MLTRVSIIPTVILLVSIIGDIVVWMHSASLKLYDEKDVEVEMQTNTCLENGKPIEAVTS